MVALSPGRSCGCRTSRTPAPVKASFEAGDLLVRELEVPGTSVRIAAGACNIVGREVSWQGTYYGYNIGEDTVAITATDSGGGRSDLVVARAEDPTISGSPWGHDPATDTLIYTRVIAGVDPGTTELPPGEGSAIVLARIDIPVSTATITQDMITDLRQMAQPRRERILRVQDGGVHDGTEWDRAGNITDNYERWPQGDWVATIPSWATQLQVLAAWNNVFLEPTGGTDGTDDARGTVKIFITDGTNSIETSPSAYNKNQVSGTNGYRTDLSNADQIDVPEALRGVTVDIRMYAKGTSGQDGRLVADDFAVFHVDVEALELPAPEATV